MKVTKNKPRPPFKRGGLHRLNCPACPGYTYSTVACLETVGMPVCACGTTFEPDTVELAVLLGDSSAYRLITSMVDRKINAQQPHEHEGHEIAPIAELTSRALAEIRETERAAARARIAAANRSRLLGETSSEPIPF